MKGTAGWGRPRTSSPARGAVRGNAPVLLVGVAQAALLAACATAGGSLDAASDATVTIRASDMSFDQEVVSVAAGEPFTMLLRNRDGAPHNVAIYADGSPSLKLFAGDMVTGADVTYQVPPIEPGIYVFLCELHPNMTGQLIAE